MNCYFPRALSTTSSFLIPNLLSNEVFPDAAALSLHLLDLQGSEQELKGLKMEVEDLSSSLLHQVYTLCFTSLLPCEAVHLQNIDFCPFVKHR